MVMVGVRDVARYVAFCEGQPDCLQEITCLTEDDDKRRQVAFAICLRRGGDSLSEQAVMV